VPSAFEKEIIRKLESMKLNQLYLFPYEYNLKKSAGHFTTVYVKKNSEGNYDFCFINTGSGVYMWRDTFKKNDSTITDDKIPVLIAKNLNMKDILSSNLIGHILKSTMVKYDTDIEAQHFLNKPLVDLYLKNNLEVYKCIPAQTNGTCAYSAIEVFLYLNLEEKEFFQYKKLVIKNSLNYLGSLLENNLFHGEIKEDVELLKQCGVNNLRTAKKGKFVL